MKETGEHTTTAASVGFWRHNAVFFVGSGLVAVLNYLYHPIISRALSVEQFGEVQGYLSVAVQFGVLSTVFGMVLLNIKTSMTEEDSEDIRNTVYSLGLLVAGGMSVGLLLLSPYIGKQLALESFWGWSLIAVLLLFEMVRVFAAFHLQAEKRFAIVSINDIAVSAGRLLLALLFIWLGYEILGVLGGFALAIFISLLFVYPYTKATIAPGNIVWPKVTPALRREIKYGLFIFLAISFVTFLYTADILVMRYLFSEEVAGLYAGIATIARIVVFATGSVAAVLLSHITLQQSAQQNLQTLKKGLLATVVLGGGALTVFSLFPGFIVGMLMGQSFVAMASLLPLLSLAMLLVAVVNLLVMYCIALRMYQIVPSIMVGVVSIAVMVNLWHSAPASVVWAFISGLSVVLVLLSMQILAHKT